MGHFSTRQKTLRIVFNKSYQQLLKACRKTFDMLLKTKRHALLTEHMYYQPNKRSSRYKRMIGHV